MKIKDGVILNGLSLKMRIVLITAELIWQEYGKELVITSALDGEHKAGSLHYYGYALDFRTRYFTDAESLEVYNKLKDILPGNYIVIKHSTHIHVEDRSAIWNGSNT